MRKQVYIWGIVVLAVVLIYFFFNPTNNPLFPKCPFWMLTHLQCPGCGSQRAVHALLHLDLMAALRYNAFLVFSLPYVVLLVYAEACRTRRPTFYASVQRPVIIWAYFVLVLLWWIGRNVYPLLVAA